MKIAGKKIAARVAAGALLLAASSVVACTSNDPDPMPAPPNNSGGTPSTSGGSAGANSTSGSSGASTGGSGGEATGAACTVATDCPMGQQCLMMQCACPGYAPDYCAADMKCTNPMKDPDHCGNCETKCGTQSACSAGACTPDLTTVAEIADCGSLKLQLAGTNIYALSTMSGTLSSVAVAGGAPTQVATGLTGASAFAIDDTNAYVVAGMSIQRVPLAGGAAAPVVTETAAIHDVAVSGGTLYYATGNGVKSIAATANDGTPAATLVALAASEGEPQGVAVSGAILLYGSASSFNVERCDTALVCNDPNGPDEEIRGTGHIRVGMSQGGLIFGHRSVQTDGTKVYWVNNGLQSAPIMPDAGGNYPGVGVGTPKDGGTITAFAIKGTTAYFAEQSPGATASDPPLVNFEKQAEGDADPTWLARNLAPVSSIVVDDTSVYLAAGCNVVKSAL